MKNVSDTYAEATGQKRMDNTQEVIRVIWLLTKH